MDGVLIAIQAVGGRRRHRHGYPVERRRPRYLGRRRRDGAGVRVPPRAREPSRRRDAHHHCRRGHGGVDAGVGRHRLDGLGRGQGDRQPPETDHAHRAADVVPVLRGRWHQQRALPADARHLRRLVSQRDPPVAAPFAVGRLDRCCACLQPGLGRDGSDGDPHRSRSVQLRPHQHSRCRHSCRAHRHRGQLVRRPSARRRARRRSGVPSQDRGRHAATPRIGRADRGHRDQAGTQCGLDLPRLGRHDRRARTLPRPAPADRRRRWFGSHLDDRHDPAVDVHRCGPHDLDLPARRSPR